MNKDINREQELLTQIEHLKQKVEKLEKRKKYGLVWEDKPEEFDDISKNAFPVLKEKGGKFKDVNPDDEGNFNILIEGDNYHTLSVLNYTHRNAIDIIYIDPPYNTGNKDFVYNDRFVEKEDVFKHSKWVSFIVKRLRLAKNLLKSGALIFISIDDNEFAQLKLLCDEIYGENNLIGIFTWVRKKKGSNLSKEFRKVTEYVLAYKMGSCSVSLHGQSAYSEKQVPLLNRPNNISTLSFPAHKIKIGGGVENGVIKKQSFGNGELAVDLLNDIQIKDGLITSPFKVTGRFRWAQGTVDDELRNGSIFTVSKTFRINVARYNQSDKFKSPSSLLTQEDGIGTNEDATEELRNIFSELDKLPFDYPKPVSLIQHFIASVTRKNTSATVLDFMAGSGTTGHAVLKLNKEDGGNRKFILNTNNENNICEEVTYERIKRVIKGYTTPKGEKVEGLGGKLKYLKTDFVPKQVDGKVTDEDKLALAYEAGLMLALKEDTFDKREETDFYQIFDGANKATAVYFRENKEKLNELLEKLERSNIQTKLYIFSWDKGGYKDAFTEYENIVPEDIPEPILEVYKSIGL